MDNNRTGNIIRLCEYIHDKRSGEMIESKGFTKTYLGFESISQQELDQLCLFAKEYVLKSHEDIANHMGEIYLKVDV